MTGNNSTPGEKLRALFMATLMVLSVMAAGVAFTGSAAAAGNATDVTINGLTAGNADTVGDTITVEVENVSSGATITVNNLVDGEEVQSVSADGPGNNTDPVELTINAGKSGEIRVLENDTRYITNQTYNSTDYLVKTTDARLWGDSTSINGEIYRYFVEEGSSDNLLEDTTNVDYAIYNPNGTEVAQGDTSDGTFSQGVDFNYLNSTTSDYDYPADGATDPSYTTYVKPDPNNNNPGAGPNQNNGSALTRVTLDATVDTDPSSLVYGDDADVSGELFDGRDNARGNYRVEVQSNDTTKIKGTDTLGDGSFLFSMTFDDAGYWDYGTNRSGFIKYDSIFVDSAEGSLTIEPQDTQRNFQSNYTVTFRDTEDNLLDINGDDDAYVNITGEFNTSAGITVTDANGTNLANTTTTNSDGDTTSIRVNSTTGEFYLEATPISGDAIDGYAQWEETTRDTPDVPDITATGSANLVAAGDINLLNDDILDQGNATNLYNSIDLDGDGEFAETSNQTVKVLPLASGNFTQERLIGVNRVGNDSNFGFDDTTNYALTFELVNKSNVDFTFDTTTEPNITSIQVDGAGINNGDGLNITGAGDNYQYNGGTHNVTFKPLRQDSLSDNITFTINVEFANGSTGSTTYTTPVEGLRIDRFDTGSQTDISEVIVGSQIDLTSVVQEPDGVPINNGKVRISQDTASGRERLGNFDARVSNTNNGEYTFNDLNVTRVAYDDNNDGIAETDTPLVFTAYQYNDSNGNQALEQNEVVSAAVRTLDVAPANTLDITFENDEEHEYPNGTANTANLTAGVGYDNISITVEDPDGQPVNLTAGDGGNPVSWSDIGSQLISINGANVTLDPAESNASAGEYVITDINNSAESADYRDDGVILFNNSQIGSYDINVTRPSMNNSDAAMEGHFEVKAPQVESEIVATTRNDGTRENVSDVTTMTTDIGRNYTVEATVFDGEGNAPLNGSTGALNVSLYANASGWNFSVGGGAYSETVNATTAGVINTTTGTFQYNVTPGDLGGVQYDVLENDTVTGSETVNDVNATALPGGPTADTPTVNVLDFAGAPIPNQDWQTDDEKETAFNGAVTDGIVLPKDVQNRVRVEAFPADDNDVALPSVYVGISNSDPVSESAVFTQTRQENASELASNYSEGQLGSFSFTPTGTGSDIVQIRWSFQSETPILNDQATVVETVDVNSTTEKLEVTGLPSSVSEGSQVNGTVVTQSTQEPTGDVRVVIEAPDGTVDTLTTQADGQFNFTASQGGAYSVRTVRVGFEPSDPVTVLSSAPANFEVNNLDPLDATVDRGQTVTVSADIANVGNQQGTTEVSLVISNSSGDVFTTSRNVTVQAGSGTNVNFDADTSALSAGNYTHTIEAAGDSESGNLTILASQPPTFEVSNLSAPSNATVGETITVTADVTNTGDSDGTKTVDFRIDGVGTLASTNETVLSGETSQVSFNVDTSSLTAGNYTHGVYTEDDNETAQIELTAEAEPSFDVSNLSAPSNATVGETITVTADVTNTGDSGATKAVDFRIDGVGTLASTNETLLSGQTTQVSFNVDTSSLTPGNYTHGVYTEDDNETAQIELTGEAEFEISDFDVPSNITQGDDLTTELNVTNVGNAAGSTPVSLSINGTDVSTGTGSADIAFMIDSSGTMSEEIQGVQDGLTNFTETLESQGVDVRYAVVTFADQQPYNLRQGYTSNVTATQQTVNNIFTSGSTERSFDTINGSIDDLNERSSANEFFLTFTDEDSDTEGISNDLGTTPSATEIANRLDSEEISLFAVTLPESSIEIEEPDLSVGRVANLSQNGQFFNLAEGDFSAKFEDEISGAVASAATGQTVSLNASESQTVSLTINGSETQNLAPGNYTVELTAGDDSVNTTLEVESQVQIPGANNPAQDLDGDGTFEDLNGDGSFTPADVTTLFNNRNSAAVQDNQALFDFNGDGSFTPADVTTLFNSL